MKYVAIRKELDGRLYMDKNFFERFKEEDLSIYNYIKVEIDDKYFDELQSCDFELNEETNQIIFSETKFNERIKKEVEQAVLPQLIRRLEELTKDFVRVNLGAIIEDLEDRQQEYRDILDEVRRIQGKGPVKYNIIKKEEEV